MANPVSRALTTGANRARASAAPAICRTASNWTFSVSPPGADFSPLDHRRPGAYLPLTAPVLVRGLLVPPSLVLHPRQRPDS